MYDLLLIFRLKANPLDVLQTTSFIKMFSCDYFDIEIGEVLLDLWLKFRELNLLNRTAK